MLRRFSLFVLSLIAVLQFALAQDGKVTGKVLDEKGQPVSAATVMLLNGETVVNGAITDDQGVFSIQPVDPGTYNVKVEYLTSKSEISGVTVLSGNTRDLGTIQFKGAMTGVTVEEQVITEFKIPPFEKSREQGMTLDGKEVAKLGTRDVKAVAAITPGVYAGDRGGELSIRGTRSSGTIYIVDGVKVRGTPNLPQKAIGQIQVIIGGTPPEFGDFTGGVVNITTAQPASKMAGGVELVTSELLDAYGRDLVGVNLSGPIAKRKEYYKGANGKDTFYLAPLLGFFFSGEYDYNRDNDPGSIGIYKLPDSTLKSLQETPLQLTDNGQNFITRSSFIKEDQLIPIKTKPFNADQRIRGLLRLDFQPTKNILVKVGGSYEDIRTDQFGIGNTIFAPDNRGAFKGSSSRAWVRFQQTFRNEKGALRNFFYSVQGDYSNYNRNFMNNDFKTNVWDYGYVGKFDYDHKPIYNYTSDPTGDPGSSGGYWKTVGYYNDNLSFDATNSKNPIMANYNSQIVDYVNGGGMYGQYLLDRVPNLDFLRFFNGIRNGDNPQQVYSLYSGVGSNYGNYLKYNYDQFRLTGQTTAEIKGKNSESSHNIKAGFEFEQRTERYYGLGARRLWEFGRLFTNNHLNNLETDPTKWEYITKDGEFQDTVSIPVKYDGSKQYYFDKQLRAKLGIAENSTEWVNLDAVDPSKLSLDMFSASELLYQGNGALGGYYGYDYLGNKAKRVDPGSFFTDSVRRPMNAFAPTYISAYVQDKFELKDIIFNVGFRVDRFDANQWVLKDAYSLFPIYSAEETAKKLGVNLPSNVDGSWTPYVDNATQPSTILGYRNGDTWYDKNGVPTSSNDIARLSGGTVKPYVKETKVGANSFTDYKPQTIFMPRISFSFPITDKAVFFAHYDVLAQRPGQNGSPAAGSLLAGQLADYYYLAYNPTVDVTNPNLKPEVTIDYEVGFRQKLSENTALSLSAYYREMRGMIQSRRFQNAYPFTYNSYDNIDFGTVKGFTASYDMRRIQNVSIRLSYTLQFATATGSDFTSSRNVNDVLQGTGLLRTLLPVNYDQRHHFTSIIDYRFGENSEKDKGPHFKIGKKTYYPLADAGANLTLDFGSGTPFSRYGTVTSIESGSVQSSQLTGAPLSNRLPWRFRADLRIDKNFYMSLKKKTDDGKILSEKKFDINVYILALNLFNTQNIAGVYGYTGLPFDDGFLSSAQGQQLISSKADQESYKDLYNAKLKNPSNVSIPRRIRLGVQFNF